MAWVVELLLPVRDPEGTAYPSATFSDLRHDLTERFGGVTAYVRAPAKGRWKDAGRQEQDDVVLYEVMTPDLDRDWWRALRGRLETGLRQKEILMRAHQVEPL
jgi:hypothetical protein